MIAISPSKDAIAHATNVILAENDESQRQHSESSCGIDEPCGARALAQTDLTTRLLLRIWKLLDTCRDNLG